MIKGADDVAHHVSSFLKLEHKSPVDILLLFLF